jgi:predicted RNA binding protein YcfA (HicA-like mRNA interferase family)
MRPRKLLDRIKAGNVHNARFSDIRTLLLAMGFYLDRITGSHHIFLHEDVPEAVNLQQIKGQCRAYQVRQVIDVIERYHLELR